VVQLNNSKKSEKHQWYINIFDDMDTDWEAIVDVRDSQKEAGFIEGLVSKKGIALDLCCGTGRHSIALRKRRWNIIGLDLSKNLLAIAKQRMKDADAKFPLVRADMRHFPFKNEAFDAIINMFTSFGYLPSESEDVKSLLEVHRTLKKNGRFLLDLANRDHIVRNFRERDWAEFEPFYLLERRSLDMKNSKLIGYWTLIQKGTGEIRELQHEVRMYTLARIEQLLIEAGLSIKELYGGYENQEFNLESSRMIMLAQKNARADVRDLITHRFPLAEFEKATETAADPAQTPQSSAHISNLKSWKPNFNL